jgi:hypothetical protein
LRATTRSRAGVLYSACWPPGRRWPQGQVDALALCTVRLREARYGRGRARLPKLRR